jgi:carboxyl-terminal processing protease
MKPSAVLVFSLLLSFGVDAQAQSASASPKILLHDRIWIATQIYSSISANFAHWRAVPNLDFDKEFQSYLDQVLGDDDRRKFDMATLELVAKLENGHTRFLDKWLMDNFGEPLGFTLRPIGIAWVVAESQIADVHPGDSVRAIDGQPFEDFFHNAVKYIATSSEREARFALVYCQYLFPESFTLQLANRTVHITRRRDLTQNKPRSSAEERDGGLYLRIQSFGDQNVESSAVDAIEKHLKSPFIIIDVRGNGGGSTPQGLLARLMEKPYHIWRESTPDHIGIFRAWGAERGELSWSGTFTPSEDRYRGPIYLLVDGGCASACEDFVAPFKETQRAVILGEATWGSTGQTISTDFGNGMMLNVSTKRESFPDGSQFEGVGITPTIEVQVTERDLTDGKDPVLEEALAMARKGDAKR